MGRTMPPLLNMSNVNDILEEIQKSDLLSRSWRASSDGATYAPVTGEVWRVDPSTPFGSPLGRQTAVHGTVSGMDRAFWPSWLIKKYPVPQGTSSQVTLKGHLLDDKEVSSLSLEDLLKILQEKDLRVDSIESTLAFKRVYDDSGNFIDLRKEVINFYRWKTVERTQEATPAEEAPAEE